MILFRHLLRRVMRRGRIVGLLALTTAPALVFLAASPEVDETELEVVFAGILATIGFVYALAVLVVSSSILREERDAGTLPYLYMRPISRLGFAASSTAAGIGASLFFALGAWMWMLLAGLAQGVEFDVMWSGLVFLAAAGVGYAGVFVPLGYLVTRSVLIGLGYLILVESILAEAVSGLAQFSVWRISLSIYSDLYPTLQTDFAVDEALGGVTAGAGGGAAKVVAILLAGGVVLTWALRKRDAL